MIQATGSAMVVRYSILNIKLMIGGFRSLKCFEIVSGLSRPSWPVVLFLSPEPAAQKLPSAIKFLIQN